MWPLGVDVFSRYYGEYNDELAPFVETMLHKRVVVRLEVERTVSWDHRKLGLPRPGPAPAPGPERCTSRSTSPLGHRATRWSALSSTPPTTPPLSGMPTSAPLRCSSAPSPTACLGLGPLRLHRRDVTAVQAVLDPTS